MAADEFPVDYRQVHCLDPMARVLIIRKRLCRGHLTTVALDLATDVRTLAAWLRVEKPRSKTADPHEVLSQADTERLLDVIALIGGALTVVNGEGTSRSWLGDWLSQPTPALTNLVPGSLLDTACGRQLVLSTLLRAVFGVYA